MKYHKCSIGDKSLDLAVQGNMSAVFGARRLTKVVQCVSNNREMAPASLRKCSPVQDAKCRSRMYRPQTVCLQEFSRPIFDQHIAITVTMAEPAFIRKCKRSPLRPPMRFGVKPLTSQMAMTWSQWSKRYRLGSELSSKKTAF
ncbi:uncharacterized protein TNCV_1061601 [Trichonephila clavipes]|nr:uncharacterized protein TNCV_1061601 [Trichonephila clavipes]